MAHHIRPKNEVTYMKGLIFLFDPFQSDDWDDFLFYYEANQRGKTSIKGVTFQ